MNIPTIKRPWIKPSKQGNRYNPDPRYQSTRWKVARKAFRMGHTRVTVEQFSRIITINPVLSYTKGLVSNEFCFECYLEGKLMPGSNTDHNNRAKDDGVDFWDQTNWRTLCDPHHARKSAKEGNELKKKQ
jgi:hypothetical protein